MNSQYETFSECTQSNSGNTPALYSFLILHPTEPEQELQLRVLIGQYIHLPYSLKVLNYRDAKDKNLLTWHKCKLKSARATFVLLSLLQTLHRPTQVWRA